VLFRTICASTFDGATNAGSLSIDLMAGNGQVRREMDIIVDQETIFVTLRHINPHKLGDDLASNGHPKMIDSEYLQASSVLSTVVGDFPLAIMKSTLV
jgi:hypothetical protein